MSNGDLAFTEGSTHQMLLHSFTALYLSRDQSSRLHYCGRSFDPDIYTHRQSHLVIVKCPLGATEYPASETRKTLDGHSTLEAHLVGLEVYVRPGT